MAKLQRFISISKAAKILQVSPDTLRNWEKEGKLVPARTPGGARRYSTSELLALKKEINPFRIGKKGLLSVSQAAKELKISPDTLRNWDKEGVIESQRTKGRARRFTRSEVKRLQDELGIEPAPVVLPVEQATNFTPEIHRFSASWRMVSSMMLITLILVVGFLLQQNIDSQGKKVSDSLNLIDKIAKSVESLQSGVYGIQTQAVPSPTPTSSPATSITYIQTSPSITYSVLSPLTLEKQVIGCKDCLTSSLNYLSGTENSDGSLSIRTSDKVAKISLETNHTNNWAVNQTFGGGALFNGGNVGIGATTSTNKLDVWGNTRLAGNLTVDGSIYSNPADLAEMYPVKGDLSEGDLVELVGETVGFAVQKASSTSGNKLIGVISTNPGSVLGYDAKATSQKPVALAGRVPLKVSDENGPIEVGDYLTSSSIPGVAAKATSPGVVIGQALEAFDEGLEPDQEENHLFYMHVRMGTILAFVNVSFADPGNFLSSLSMDSEGNLIVPRIKVGSLMVDAGSSNLDLEAGSSSIEKANPSSSIQHQSSNVYYDLTGKIASLEERVKSLEEKLDVGGEKLDKTESATATDSANLASNIQPQDQSSNLQYPTSNLDLTPPDILLATGSATLANLKVTDTLSSDKLVIASDSQISGDLKVFGKTTLSNTTIAGDLSIDGTLSIEDGNEINVIGTLYLQKSSLAQGLDVFNGLVTIDKLGNLRAQTVTVSEFKVIAGKISGSGKIEAGKKEIEIENPLVKSSSRILITPTIETNLVLAVTAKVEGEKFTVSSPQITDKDIFFDWFLVGESL